MDDKRKKKEKKQEAKLLLKAPRLYFLKMVNCGDVIKLKAPQLYNVPKIVKYDFFLIIMSPQLVSTKKILYSTIA